MAGTGIDVFGSIGGAVSGGGSSVIGVIAFLQLPLVLMFIALTVAISYMLYFRRIAIVMAYPHTVTLIYPYADKTLSVFQERGARCAEDGIPRFALKNEKCIIQRPDTSNFYPNNEIILLSLSPLKKMYAWRAIDRENRTMTFDTEDPNVAQMYFADSIEKRDPDYMLNQISNMTLMITIWFITGLMLFFSNLITLYPIYLHFFK